MDTIKKEEEEERGGNRFSKSCKTIRDAISDFFTHPENEPCNYLPQKYSYIFRKKSRWELTRMSAIVIGIDFVYSAETAYVTPVLLSLGLNVKYVSMIWCFSPLLAFLLTPVLGSLSDSCQSRFGRRRPFIFALSIGLCLGLILVPYGGRLGLLLGDKYDAHIRNNQTAGKEDASFTNHSFSDSPKHTLSKIKEEMLTINKIPNSLNVFDKDANLSQKLLVNSSYFDEQDNINKSLDFAESADSKVNARTYGIIITVIGTVFLDFCADVCQSPCRAYLLDITIPQDHAAGLTAFCLNSALGSAVGYGLSAIKWNIKIWDNILESQAIMAFALMTLFYLFFLSSSIGSFPEIPRSLLKDPYVYNEYQSKMKNLTKQDTKINNLSENNAKYSTVEDKGISTTASDRNIVNKENGINGTQHNNIEMVASSGSCSKETQASKQTSLRGYLKSIIFMPRSILLLCLTNFFCGMGILSYTLFFTDFVGECVFGGNPHAPKDSKSYELYKDGVRFGCWGMSFASLCCAFASVVLEDLVERFGAKLMFVGGAVVYSVGMVLMAVSKHKIAVIILSATAGIIYTTQATMPFILIAHYHTLQKFKENSTSDDNCERGIGTDIATVMSVIIFSQCILSISMGTVVSAVGSNVVTVWSSALFSACGAISATQVMYLEK